MPFMLKPSWNMGTTHMPFCWYHSLLLRLETQLHHGWNTVQTWMGLQTQLKHGCIIYAWYQKAYIIASLRPTLFVNCSDTFQPRCLLRHSSNTVVVHPGQTRRDKNVVALSHSFLPSIIQNLSIVQRFVQKTYNVSTFLVSIQGYQHAHHFSQDPLFWWEDCVCWNGQV